MDAIATDQRIQGLKSLIGNTPLLAIDYTFEGEQRTLYAKAEHLNMTGSITKTEWPSISSKRRMPRAC